MAARSAPWMWFVIRRPGQEWQQHGSSLQGVNSYTGATTVNAGKLSISANANLGSPAAGGGLILASSTTLATTATMALDNAGANSRLRGYRRRRQNHRDVAPATTPHHFRLCLSPAASSPRSIAAR